MYEKLLDIDYDRLVAKLLPVKKRSHSMVHWLLCLISPVVELHQQLLARRRDWIYKIDHTCQVFSMEKVLNDAFDKSERRIYIMDGEYTLPVWFYDRADDKPVFFFDRASDRPVVFYDRKSLETLNVDFTVIMPIAVLTDAETIRLKALIDFYRLPDKTYTIRYE